MIKTTSIDRILEKIAIPKIYTVQQKFENTSLIDIEKATKDALSPGIVGLVKPKQRVALAVGSRGIANLPELILAIIKILKNLGAQPFIVPAMGSHGGASAEGQKEVLAKIGITEDSMGIKIESSMDVVDLGEVEPGLPVYSDKFAASADATLLIGRVKPHTSFRGPYESGLMKMAAVGLGKQKGAEICHKLGFSKIQERFVQIAETVLEKSNIVGGVAVIENALHQLEHIELVPANSISIREPELLKLSWEFYPSLPFNELDVLIIQQIGKDISGTGLDSNVVGRYNSEAANGGPEISRVVVLDASPKTGGNLNGIGLSDITTKRVFEKIDFEETYPNSLTSTATQSVKIPMVMKNDKAAIQAAIRTCNASDLTSIRLGWIQDTLSLNTIKVSERVQEEVSSLSRVQVETKQEEMRFTKDGTLII